MSRSSSPDNSYTLLLPSSVAYSEPPKPVLPDASPIKKLEEVVSKLQRNFSRKPYWLDQHLYETGFYQRALANLLRLAKAMITPSIASSAAFENKEGKEKKEHKEKEKNNQKEISSAEKAPVEEKKKENNSYETVFSEHYNEDIGVVIETVLNKIVKDNFPFQPALFNLLSQEKQQKFIRQFLNSHFRNDYYGSMKF